MKSMGSVYMCHHHGPLRVNPSYLESIYGDAFYNLYDFLILIQSNECKSQFFTLESNEFTDHKNRFWEFTSRL